MVEQAAERRSAQSGLNAFSFFRWRASWLTYGGEFCFGVLRFSRSDSETWSALKEFDDGFRCFLTRSLRSAQAAPAPFVWTRRLSRFDGSRWVHAATDRKKCSLRWHGGARGMRRTRNITPPQRGQVGSRGLIGLTSRCGCSLASRISLSQSSAALPRACRKPR